MTTAASADLLGPIVAHANQLYSLPGVALEVVQLSSQPFLDTRALKECLENDPALTARILKVVNSSIFGLPRKVIDLSQAVGLLGIKPLKMLVLGFSLPKQLWEGVEAQSVAWYWRHSLVKAVAARELSARLRAGDDDEAFLAALFQDVGILVLMQQIGSPFLKLLVESRGDPEALCELTRQSLGFDHVELGSRLLAHWGLPQPLVTAVGYPRERSAVQRLNLPERTTAQALHLAHLLTSILDNPAGPAMGEMLEAGQAYCRLTIEEIQEIMAVVQGKVRDLSGILKLDLGGGESYTDLIAAAHRQLASVAESAGITLAWRDRERQLLARTKSLRDELHQAAVASAAGKPLLASPFSGRTESASRDPHPGNAAAVPVAERLTLAANPLLTRRVADAVARCRSARAALSLVLFGVDDFAARLGGASVKNQGAVTHAIASGLTLWTEDRGPVWHLEKGLFALLWEGADRNEAVNLMRHALKEAHLWSAEQPGGAVAGLTFSAGLATLEIPSKNFPPHELIEGAERCLGAATLSGGHTVKTIVL